MIKFDNVTKTFPDGTRALTDIYVEIPNNQFTFLIGPSGAGKTTMLRLLLRDLTPTTGEIYVDDFKLTHLPQKDVHLLRRKIGTIFQDYRLLHDRNVFENVALSLQINDLSDEKIAKRVDEVLETVGIAGKKSLFPQQLSGGELQRTAIARAIIGEPEIILADEPTADLDPKNSWEIIDLLSKINQLGTTVIMATHNAQIVNKLKKRVIQIDKGKVVKDVKKGSYESS